MDGSQKNWLPTAPPSHLPSLSNCPSLVTRAMAGQRWEAQVGEQGDGRGWSTIGQRITKRRRIPKRLWELETASYRREPETAAELERGGGRMRASANGRGRKLEAAVGCSRRVGLEAQGGGGSGGMRGRGPRRQPMGRSIRELRQGRVVGEIGMELSEWDMEEIEWERKKRKKEKKKNRNIKVI
jgi:hypothetical protein